MKHRKGSAATKNPRKRRWGRTEAQWSRMKAHEARLIAAAEMQVRNQAKTIEKLTRIENSQMVALGRISASLTRMVIDARDELSRLAFDHLKDIANAGLKAREREHVTHVTRWSTNVSYAKDGEAPAGTPALGGHACCGLEQKR